MERVKILFLAANPSGDLRLDEEIREIAAKIRAARYRDSLELVSGWAVRPDDLQQALLEHQPHILHFSGHGHPSDGIILLDDDPDADPASQSKLVDLLRTLKDNLKLVVLNSCYSQPQAEAIAQVVDCTIGMDKAIGDQAAIKFAAAFYRALGFGRSVKDAFDLGLNSLTSEGPRKEKTSAEPHRKLILPTDRKAQLLPDDQIPRLMTRQGVDASAVFPVKSTLDVPDRSASKLHVARDRVKQLVKQRADQTEIDAAKADVLAARREIREGGRLRTDDVLLDRYELLECVGSGGFATVWRCFDEQTMKIVAAKILHPSHREERTRIDRFFRGARMMKQLSHENIVRVLEERCSDEGFHFYIMEFVDGDDFQEAILSKRVLSDDVLEIILAAADALHHAHTTLPDLVHRDVKPSNILLAADGQVRVTDFDLVRTADTTGGTRTGSLGTFIYTAPESLQKAGEVDARADVFSLGMTALFGLYGSELPVAAFRHTADFIDALDCGEVIKKTLKQAVEWEPAERFASMRDFIEAIRAALEDDASAKRKDPPSLSEQAPGKPVRKRLGKAGKKSRSSRPSKLPHTGESLTNSIGMQLLLLSDDEFLMGSPDAEQGASARETPQHPVWLTKPFYMGIHAVTQAEYKLVMESNPSRFHGEVRRPVETVSWFDAVHYCNKLSEREGLESYYLVDGQNVSIIGGTGYRLPTEAEWEYACRAGTTSKWSCGDNVRDVDAAAWHSGNSSGETHAVGGKAPNPWGLYDMHGNVWEWCWNWYGDYSGASVSDPSGPPAGSGRVMRGGSFSDGAGRCRSAVRYGLGLGFRSVSVGFRVSRTYN